MPDPFQDQPAAPALTGPAGATGPSVRVLIVDDSAMTRAMVRRSVTLSGIPADLSEAPDGEAALAALRQAGVDGRPFDICFLDLNMPRVGGMEVAIAVRDDDALPTRVVIVSSESMASRVRQLQDAGVAGYVRKPFRPEQIRQVLVSVLSPAAVAA